MTKDEWKNYKDFDMLSREMNGEFGGSMQNWRSAEGSFLNQQGHQQQQQAQNRKVSPKAE